MNIEEIRNSGLLESYIIGSIKESERKQVEQFLTDFPELKAEINQVERAFRNYAEINGIEPRPELKAEIIKSITGKTININSSPPKKGFGPFFFPAIALACLLAGSLFWGNKNSNEANKLQSDYSSLSEAYTNYQVVCDSISDANAELEAMLAILNNAGNRLIPLTATEKYASTTLYLHTNNLLKKNYLQAVTLPPLATNQAFQLWSLKPGQDPIPLSVFSDAENPIFEVDFENGTATYAITIEPSGGSQVPNLTHLIGTMGV